MFEKIQQKAPGTVITAHEWNQIAKLVQSFVNIHGENGIYVNKTPLGITIGQQVDPAKIIKEQEEQAIIGELKPVSIESYGLLENTKFVHGRYIIGIDDNGSYKVDPPPNENPLPFFVLSQLYSSNWLFGDCDIRDCYPPLIGMVGVGAKLTWRNDNGYGPTNLLISPTVALPEVRIAKFVGINETAHSMINIQLKKFDGTFYDDTIPVEVLSYGNEGEHGLIDLNNCLPKLDVGDIVMVKQFAKLDQTPPVDSWTERKYWCISPHFIRVC